MIALSTHLLLLPLASAAWRVSNLDDGSPSDSTMKRSCAHPLKLLIVSDYAYPSGGVEHFIQEFIAAVSSRFECKLLSWSASVRTPPGFERITVIECGDIRQAWSEMDWADVLFIPTSFNVRMLTRLATEYVTHVPKPVVTVVHTVSHSRPHAPSVAIQSAWLAELLSKSSHIVAVSGAVAVALRDLPHPEEYTSRLSVIENAARLTPRLAPRRSAASGDSRRRVSFIGRPFPQKGFDLFVRLAHDLRDTEMTFAANTVSVPLLEPLEGVTLSALLSDAELVTFFEQTDLLVIPYLYADGLPLAVLEALNCGVPIIGFDSPGVGSLLRSHAQLVIAPNYAALRSAVEEWHAGRLIITPPHAGSIDSWAEAFDRYSAIVEAIGVPTDE